MMNVAILIDYDNLGDSHKSSGLLDLATKILMRLPKADVAKRGRCLIRLYGGWFENNSMTPQAQKLHVDVSENFPALIRVPCADDATAIISTRAELAMALMEEPGHYLFSTFRRKGKPRNIRVQTPQEAGCKSSSCLLPSVARLLKNGKCSLSTCDATEGELVYRHEQKIVDTMLTCDLLHVAEKSQDEIVLVSSDDDFIPPLRTLLLRGASVYRVHAKPVNWKNEVSVSNPRLKEVEL